MNKISVIILHYSNIDDTKECVESVLKSEKKELEFSIIIVNNSGDNLSEIEKLSKNIEIINPGKNLGYSAGNNIGIKKGLEDGADFLLLLNNDALVEKNAIEELVKFSEEENVDLVSPKIYFYKGNEYHKNRYKKEDLGKVVWYAGGSMDWENVIGFHRGVDEVDNGQFDESYPTDFASGCCMLVKRKVFESIGFLDERYFLYYEDNDFSQRAKLKGFYVMYDPSAIVWHKNAGSSGSGSSLQDYYLTRNRLLFGFSYASMRAKIALFRESIGLLFFGRKWQKKGVLDFYTHNLRKGSFASD